MLLASFICLTMSMDFHFLLNNSVSISAALLFIALVVLLLIHKLQEKNGITKKKKYHPIGGTILNQLINFNRLHHYMTDLAAKYRTYRLISPFRNEIYTSDPANVEYILKTNFKNYGKVLLKLSKNLNLLQYCFSMISSFFVMLVSSALNSGDFFMMFVFFFAGNCS